MRACFLRRTTRWPEIPRRHAIRSQGLRCTVLPSLEQCVCSRREARRDAAFKQGERSLEVAAHLARDWRFESISLQRRVSELSVPRSDSRRDRVRAVWRAFQGSIHYSEHQTAEPSADAMSPTVCAGRWSGASLSSASSVGETSTPRRGIRFRGNNRRADHRGKAANPQWQLRALSHGRRRS